MAMKMHKLCIEYLQKAQYALCKSKGPLIERRECV